MSSPIEWSQNDITFFLLLFNFYVQELIIYLHQIFATVKIYDKNDLSILQMADSSHLDIALKRK